MVNNFSEKSSSVLHQLFEVIEQRRREMPQNSYTSTLFLGGIKKINEKIKEESQELIEAAENFLISSEKDKNGDKTANAAPTEAQKQVVHEAADLMYHFLVILAACDLSLYDVDRELSRRFGKSGLSEKAERKGYGP
jgi:phosphoribosyl-ATP pyrophosphohydrolase